MGSGFPNSNADDLNRCQLNDGSNLWQCPVVSCMKKLSRKQILKNHISNIHGIQVTCSTKIYKRYEYDSQETIPRTTYFRKRKQAGQSSHMQDWDDDQISSSQDTSGENQELSESDRGLTEASLTNTKSDSEFSDSDMDISDSQSTVSDSSSYRTNTDTCSSSDDESGNTLEEPSQEQPSDAPLYVTQIGENVAKSQISYRDHILAVSGFATRHNLSDTALKHLIDLIDLHIPEKNLLDSSVEQFKKMSGFEAGFLTYNTFCSICKNVFSGEEENCKTRNCSGKKLGFRSQCYFVTGNLQTQLKEILSRGNIWQDIQNRSHVSSTLSDITSGSEYKKLKTEGEFLHDKSNISLSVFTDGIPLFKSSGVSLWPVYLLINEIPANQRFLRQNMLLWGIWQGSGKPNMTLFLKPLVSDLLKLYYDGISFMIEDTVVICKAILVVATMDLPARASVLRMTSHSGEFPCNFCMEPGKIVKSGKGHCRVFPFREEPAALRTDAEILRDSKQSQKTGKRVNGFTGESVLLYLPHFSLSTNIVVDYMHGILIGVTKKLLILWFDPKYSKSEFFIGSALREVDDKLKKINPPHMIKRLPRKLTNNINHWKASELRSWLLYYSLPCLLGKLPDLYLKHFSLLVETTYILLGEGITEDDLQRCTLLLKIFVKNSSELYEDFLLGINVHNLTHLVDIVRRWGPLWAWSCFCFESFNGEIKKAIHGTGNVCRQIFWSLQTQKQIENITSKRNVQGQVNMYLQKMKNKKSSNVFTQEGYQCLVIKPQNIKSDLFVPDHIKKTLSSHWNNDAFYFSKKIIRNDVIMYSKSCSKVKKNNSFVIQLEKTMRSIGDHFEVNYFLMDKSNKHVYAVGKALQIVSSIIPSRVPHLQKLNYSSIEEAVIGAEYLSRVTVVVRSDDVNYVTVMPNNIERD